MSERSRIDFDRPGLGRFDHFPDGHAVEVFRGELVGRARRAVRDLAAVSQVLLDQALKVLLWFAGWLRGCHGGPSVFRASSLNGGSGPFARLLLRRSPSGLAQAKGPRPFETADCAKDSRLQQLWPNGSQHAVVTALLETAAGWRSFATGLRGRVRRCRPWGCRGRSKADRGCEGWSPRRAAGRRGSRRSTR